MPYGWLQVYTTRCEKQMQIGRYREALTTGGRQYRKSSGVTALIPILTVVFTQLYALVKIQAQFIKTKFLK